MMTLTGSGTNLMMGCLSRSFGKRTRISGRIGLKKISENIGSIFKDFGGSAFGARAQ
jgi:hypothetical protein